MNVPACTGHASVSSHQERSNYRLTYFLCAVVRPRRFGPVSDGPRWQPAPGARNNLECHRRYLERRRRSHECSSSVRPGPEWCGAGLAEARSVATRHPSPPAQFSHTVPRCTNRATNEPRRDPPSCQYARLRVANDTRPMSLATGGRLCLGRTGRSDETLNPLV